MVVAKAGVHLSRRSGQGERASVQGRTFAGCASARDSSCTSDDKSGLGRGIPFKIDNGGSLRDARASTLDCFVATTDTFAGNSGSAVYETSGYTVRSHRAFGTSVRC